jgi:hypothetical protein
MTSYISPYTGQTINPSQVGYESLTIGTDTILEWPINGNVTNVVANIVEVTATATGLRLFMPPATQVSDGQSALIRNVGSNPFYVVKSDGTAIATVNSGVAEYIYVTNNTTDPGSWSAVTFGTGTSAANAADLAGYGLMAINSTLNQAYQVTNVYSNYTFLPADRASFYVWSSGAGALTLPSAGTVGNDWFVMIRNGGTGILTIYPQGTNTLDGLSSVQLQINESFVVVSNGTTGYNSFGYGQSAQFFFTILSKVVTGGTVTLTSAEASNIIQEYTGVLTSNCIVILPPTVQIYSLQNNTTGSYNLTFKTTSVGASTVTVPRGSTYLVVCDGTNVYTTSSGGGGGSITSVTLNNGSASAPTLNFVGDTVTGLYLAASGQLGFTIGGTNAATLTSSGLLVPVGISGGAF